MKILLSITSFQTMLKVCFFKSKPRFEDPLLRAIKHYENHPSVKGIEGNVERKTFSFSFATFLILNNN